MIDRMTIYHDFIGIFLITRGKIREEGKEEARRASIILGCCVIVCRPN